MEGGMISWLISWSAWLSPFVFLYWILVSECDNKKKSPYSNPGWHFRVKRLWAYLTISRVKAQRADRIAKIRASHPKYHLPPSHYEEELELPRQLAKQDHIDSMLLWAADFQGNALIVRLTRMRHCQARIAIQLTLKDGSIYQLPQSPDTFVSTTSRGWTAGGLHLEVIEPLSKWRVLFNGLLRKGQRRDWSEPAEEELHHVRFNFIWSSCSRPYNCRYDWSTRLLADTLAREPWRSGDWINTVKSHVGGYDQWGTMLGQVSGLAECEDKITLHLRGLRQRRWGSNEAGRLHRRLALSGVLENGAMFSIGADCEPGELSHASYGHLRSPDGHLYPIDWTSLSLPKLAETPEDIPRQFVLRFKAGAREYSAAFYLPGAGCLLYVGRPWNYQMLLEPMECALNTKPGIGLAELCYRYNGVCPLGRPANVQFMREPAVHSTQQLILSFSERECRSSEVVGGKGASLAALSSLQDRQFSLADGCCLTVEALKRQLTEHPGLTAAIDRVSDVASTRLPGDLEQVCADAVKLFEETPVCESVVEEIRSLVKEGERWAVRSSAVGEDSEDLSAAGQNATFLGCRNAEDVIKAVARCWASLYTHQSVSYRRQNGQKIAAEMGIVVQQMVDADTAGVLFTCDPTNGDPRRILITSNYGLGESVVSASIEPDTFIIRPGNPFRVIERICGKKDFKIVMDDKGTVDKHLGERSDTLSLTDEQAITIASMGKQLETSFGGPRDIEWAYAKGTLYLLQVRPVTSLYPYTDFELRHEADDPLVIESEVLTRANTGEVCPGACPTLTGSTIIRMLDFHCGVGFNDEDIPPHYRTYIVLNHNQLFVNVINTFLKTNSGKIEAAHIANDIAIVGHQILDDNLLKAGVERFGSYGPLQTGLLLLSMIKNAWNGQAKTDAAMKLSQNFSLRGGQSIEKANAMYKYISDRLPILHDATSYHLGVSRVSSFAQVMVMTVLVEGKDEILPEHCADMAVLMKSAATGTVSSEVPEFVSATATTLLENKDLDYFCGLQPKDALAWLEINTPKEYQKLQEFLKKHGHRVLKEVDLRTITYDMDCLPLIAVLQAVVKTRKNQSEPSKPENSLHGGKTYQQAIDSLKTPRRKLTRQILRLMLPWYEKTVKRRELSKAAYVRITHEFRLAFRHLGKLLVQETILPDVDLLYFLSLWEIGQIIQTRNPNLVRKAIRRQRLFPQWENYQFSELNYGIPRPLKEEDNEHLEIGVKLKATSACPGIIKSKAFVVHRNEGPEKLKNAATGDILITYSTDIGWSPYFPVLGGVVTELGGLISHGAVVAREYGLPCIIGAQNATRVFKTGDVIILNGDTGEVQKVGE